MDVPEELSAWVPGLFDDPTRPLYAQAATVGPGGAPDVRTVHVRYVKAWDALAFAAHTGSPKWAQLKADPRLKLAFFHPRLGLQLRFAGTADLAADPAGLAELWAATDPWLRKEYGAKGRTAPADFGAVRLAVSAWDAYRVDPAHPEKNERALYRRESGAWRAERRSALL
ncbi:pyridoxamine 5'-phosphate oxidase family protein [bacterium]|nr:MAG: pyridoxamine 5'-phosphate oxidase family protein [bacterium]